MIGVPVATPVTIPVDPTVAVVPSLVLHTPPVVLLPSAVVLLTHTFIVPVIVAGADGVVFTVRADTANALPQLLVIV